MAFIKLPFEKFGTGWAEIRLFRIRILDFRRRVHDTAAVSAMGHTEAMAKFVKCGLFRSRRQQVLVGRLIIKLGSKPVHRDDRALPFHFGQAKDILKDRHEQIHIGHTHEAQGILRRKFYQML